jgi:hypothetical protein
MQDNGWDRIVDAIDTRFGIEHHGTKTEPLEDHHELTQNVRFIEFDRGGQSFRIERITKPAVLDRKSIHGRSASAGIRYENVYDSEETVHKTIFYQKVSGEWQPLDDSALATAMAG